MKIETSAGKTFDVRVICAGLRNNSRVLIEMADDRPLAEIATDFDGLASIKKYAHENGAVYEMYEGFTQLVGIQRNREAGTVRLTLEKDDEA